MQNSGKIEVGINESSISCIVCRKQEIKRRQHKSTAAMAFKDDGWGQVHKLWYCREHTAREAETFYEMEIIGHP